MALLTVLCYPDPRLHKVAKPVAQVDARIKKIVADMADTMYDAPGVGLAATQVDIHERIVVIDVSDEQNELRVFINPEITKYSNNTNWYRETCLSCGPLACNVNRSENITIRFIDKEGNEQERTCNQFWARLLQHEYDHLEGVVNITKTKPEDIEFL